MEILGTVEGIIYRNEQNGSVIESAKMILVCLIAVGNLALPMLARLLLIGDW